MSDEILRQRTFEAADADPGRLAGRTVAVIGYGNQGHAHAQNLRDSGVEVVVGQRPGRGADAAAADGFPVLAPAEAAARAQVVMVLVPDEVQARLWQEELRGAMRPDAYLAFAHGFAVAFGLLDLPPGQRIFLAAPKGQGHALRRAFVNGGGLPGLLAVEGPEPAETLRTALAYAAACGCLAGGAWRTSFREEAVTDLFGEQVVLVGGLVELITAAWETLVARGYSEEGAYFECLHEVKIIADLLHARGVDGMREGISTTAAYGGLKAGEQVIGADSRRRMEELLSAIESGAFGRAFLEEQAKGSPWLRSRMEQEAAHPMQETGRRLRRFLERCRLDTGRKD